MASRQTKALPSNCCNPEKAPNASKEIKMTFTAKLIQNAGGCCLRPETSRIPIAGFSNVSVKLVLQASGSEVGMGGDEETRTVRMKNRVILFASRLGHVMRRERIRTLWARFLQCRCRNSESLTSVCQSAQGLQSSPVDCIPR